MKVILFLILLFNIYCKTNKYYTSCKSGAPQSGFITSSECNEYSQSGSYCCLLYYEITPEIKSSNSTYLSKNSKGRNLLQRETYCFGLTKSGFNNIDDVIDELEDDTGIDDIKILCNGINLKISILFFISIILF